MIENGINKIMEYQYTISNPISGMEDREVSLEYIKDMFVKLRNFRIDFYKAVLEKYNKRKEEYNKSLGWDLF